MLCFVDGSGNLGEALRDGKLTSSQATLVTEAVKVNPNCEQDLVRGGRAGHPSAVEGAMPPGEGRRDGPPTMPPATGRRCTTTGGCRTYTDAEGAFCLEAHLTPEAGATVLAALDSQADRYFKEARRSGLFETVDAYRADALCALVTGKRISSAKMAVGRRAIRRRKRRPSIGVPNRGPTSPCISGSTSSALRRGSVKPGEVCEIPGVGPVSVEWARAQLGVALCDLVITDGVDVTTVVRRGPPHSCAPDDRHSGA